jgi:hypothetical protein
MTSCVDFGVFASQEHEDLNYKDARNASRGATHMHEAAGVSFAPGVTTARLRDDAVYFLFVIVDMCVSLSGQVCGRKRAFVNNLEHARMHIRGYGLWGM